MVQFDRQWLMLEGYVFPPFQARIEHERIAGYVGFSHGWEEVATGLRAAEDVGAVLPTLPFSLEMDAGVVEAIADLLNVPARHLLHAGQSFEYHTELRAGELVTVESQLTRVSWQPQKQVCFFFKETHFLVGDHPAVTSLSTYAIRARQQKRPFPEQRHHE